MEPPDVFSASRRFDLATLLVAMAGFAVLFSGMRLLKSPPAWMVFLGVMFVVVAIGQMAADRWKRPREASMIVGAGYCQLCAIGKACFAFSDACVDGGLMIFAAPVGGGAGYLVGALVGGAFLISYHLRESRWMGGGKTAQVADEGKPW